MKHTLTTLALLALALPGAARAQEIDVLISVKYIVDDSGPTPQWPTGTWGTLAALQDAIDDTNHALERWGRGYRYVLHEVQSVFGASQFFDLYNGESAVLESAAKAATAQYYWRTYAINLYIVNSNATAGGVAAIPSKDGPQEIVVFVVGLNPATSWAHELGHHFDLYHTFGAGGSGGDDGLADTKPDPELSCAPQLATGAFSCTVASNNNECCCSTKIALLNAKGYSQTDHDNLLYNTMSYYGATDCAGLINPPHDFDTIRLTDDQLDRWTDASRKYSWLQGEVSGYTYFVDQGFGGTSTGYSTNPYKTVLTGLNAASTGNGKILLVRGGIYPENLTVATPITLRSAKGAATIGQ